MAPVNERRREGGAVERATPSQLYAALEERPYPSVTVLCERFGLQETAYAVLDAHYSVRYVMTYRPGDKDALDLRLALLGDAVDRACTESGRLPT